MKKTKELRIALEPAGAETLNLYKSWGFRVEVIIAAALACLQEATVNRKPSQQIFFAINKAAETAETETTI